MSTPPYDDDDDGVDYSNLPTWTVTEGVRIDGSPNWFTVNGVNAPTAPLSDSTLHGRDRNPSTDNVVLVFDTYFNSNIEVDSRLPRPLVPEPPPHNFTDIATRSPHGSPHGSSQHASGTSVDSDELEWVWSSAPTPWPPPPPPLPLSLSQTHPHLPSSTDMRLPPLDGDTVTSADTNTTWNADVDALLFGQAAENQEWYHTNGYFNPYAPRHSLNEDEGGEQTFVPIDGGGDGDPLAWMDNDGYIPLLPRTPTPPPPPRPDVMPLVPRITLPQMRERMRDSAFCDTLFYADGDINDHDHANDTDDETAVVCVICLEEFDLLEDVCYLRGCGINNGAAKLKHLFHPTCLGRWAQQQHTCPLCRNDFFGAP